MPRLATPITDYWRKDWAAFETHAKEYCDGSPALRRLPGWD